MLINQTLIFIFLIVILLVSEFPFGTNAQKHKEQKSRQRSERTDGNSGPKCWNGLGKCGDNCGESDSPKIDYHCQMSRTCCLPNKIVIAVKSIDNLTDTTPLDIPCGLNYGKCEIKCLSPTTVYRGSYNECPKRHFCCIKNDVQIKSKGSSDSSHDSSDDSESDDDSESHGRDEKNGRASTKSESEDGEEGEEREDRGDKEEKEEKEEKKDEKTEEEEESDDTTTSKGSKKSKEDEEEE